MKRHRVNINEPGHAHELTFSCYRRFPFLKADRTCQWLAEAIDDARKKHTFLVWDYVFMLDHAHLLVYPAQFPYDIAEIRETIKAPVGRKAIAYLKTSVPEWLPKITRRRGRRAERLFWKSGGGYDRNVVEKGTLLSMIDYIHANPVRKQLVERPRDWKWSSAAWYDDMTEVPLSVDPIPPDWLD